VNLKQILVATSIALSATSTMAGPSYEFDLSVGIQPANVGIITITQDDADTVIVGVDLLPGYGFINTGGPHTPFAFNLSGSGALSIDFTTPLNGIYATGVFSLNTAGGDNTPFGTYGVAIDSTAGNGSVNGYFGDLLFALTRAGGLDTTNFVANLDGYYFSADLSDGTNTGAQAWATRLEPRPPLPEPATIGLLGIGLLAMVVAARRRGA
jgi:hypothetical protein